MAKMTESSEQNAGQDCLECDNMPNIQIAYNYVVQACNDPNVGYSKTYRRKQKVNGITYYDCTSLIWYALQSGGFDVVSAYNTATGKAFWGNPITTGDEQAWLQALGFVQVPITDEWFAGDILWRRGHTEMVYSGGVGRGVTMGAHSNSYALPRQVSINTFEYTASSWTTLWRYLGSTTLDWIKGNRYLNQSEMNNNATIVYSVLTSYGWSYNAICALLGNMQVESTINPGVWQGLTQNPLLGWGLVQWSPSTNFTDWADQNNYQHDDGNAQLEWIDSVTTSFGQWVPRDGYDISFDDFKVSSESVDYLTRAFAHNFENPPNPDNPVRTENANYWYEYLQNVNPFNPHPGVRVKHMPIWMMLRRF